MGKAILLLQRHHKSSIGVELFFGRKILIKTFLFWVKMGFEIGIPWENLISKYQMFSLSHNFDFYFQDVNISIYSWQRLKTLI